VNKKAKIIMQMNTDYANGSLFTEFLYTVILDFHTNFRYF